MEGVMRAVKWCALAVSALALSACLNTSTLIRVAPDGSGTIEQTLLFNIKAVENAFAGMGFKPTGTSSSRSGPNLDEASMKKAAESLGNGITLVSVTPVRQASGYEGVTARFRFEDITTLDTSDFLMPGPAKDMAPGPGAGAGRSGSRDRVRFAMQRTPGGTSILTATFDDTTSGSGQPKNKNTAGPGLDDPEVRQMVKTLFKGFRIGIDLEIIGQMVRADADHVNGKRITLAEIDMEELLRNGDKLNSLDKVLGPDASITAMRPHLSKIKGLKINQPVVTVEFR
jgi:hypothetical protein